MVRSHLNYCSSVWATYRKGGTDALEIVQKRATKIVPALKNLPYGESLKICKMPSIHYRHTHTHNRFMALFLGPPGWAGARRELLDSLTQWKINTEADTQTIRLGATPSGLTRAHFHHPPIFLEAGCPSCRLTNTVKALKGTSAYKKGYNRNIQGSDRKICNKVVNGTLCIIGLYLLTSVGTIYCIVSNIAILALYCVASLSR